MKSISQAAALVLALSTALFAPGPISGGQALAQTTGSTGRSATDTETYSAQEIVDEGHRFFGKTTRGVAQAIESVFASQGEPTAYIVGEEGAGAFVAGLRYGEGTIYYKDGTKQRIYWQGPSLGFDFGANGSRTLVLVYNSQSPRDLYETRFGGVEGSAYVVGGLGINYQQHRNIVLAPIRTGVGARLGANVGYLKYSSQPSWNPF
jgi:hypothetical protein